MGNSKAGERIGGAGSRENKQDKEREREAREQGKEDSRASHTASHGVRVKVRYTEVRKGKSPEAKGSQDNLRKDGKKHAKLRSGIYN